MPTESMEFTHIFSFQTSIDSLYIGIHNYGRFRHKYVGTVNSSMYLVLFLWKNVLCLSSLVPVPCVMALKVLQPSKLPIGYSEGLKTKPD